MKKPTKKSKVAVKSHRAENRHISFCTDAETVKEFREFGRINSLGDSHSMIVDARYDYMEVLEYIRNYG
jgi:hypothetical protein